MKTGSRIERNMEVTVNGEELLAHVHYFLNPPEPDVGYPTATIELEWVVIDGGDVMGSMSESEEEQVVQALHDRVSGEINDY